MNAPFTLRETPKRYAIRIAAQAQTEIDRRSQRPDLYGRDCIAELREIRSLAVSLQDHLAGHEGFETAESDLADALEAWAENRDCRSFQAVPSLGRAYPFGERT